MSWWQELESRGLIQDVSDRDAVQKLPPGTPFYVGFDPTAPSLQVGNLVPIIAAIHLARAGFSPILLFGGSTGTIGDPSGRSKERTLMDQTVANENVAKHQKKMTEMMDRVGVQARFVNNLEWTRDVTFLSFLRDIGKHFPMAYMLAKDTVKSRLDGDGISFTEFCYMLLQAFDFLHLYKTQHCRLQVGGADQWGNITAGLELIRRKVAGEAYGLTFPLLTDSQGKKVGKSEGKPVWLDATMTSPYAFHQFWLNIADADVGKLLRVFTFLPLAKIQELEASVQSAPEKRAAQNALADAMCTFVHGESQTTLARRGAEVLFGGSMEGLSATDLQAIFTDVPSSTISADRLSTLTLLDLFAETKLVPSKGEARRLATGGGLYVNNERVADIQSRVADTVRNGVLVLRAGKKNYHLVRCQ